MLMLLASKGAPRGLVAVAEEPGLVSGRAVASLAEGAPPLNIRCRLRASRVGRGDALRCV
eukprot:CAMPEP_0203961816 /NCGR_PEP_ID=MMETSP0359-20131031/92175_1 /ASSEMBLY_ACC=CAM_ASM_000338 /TAXON_ID=268821 /ORGANISM="Scrippsiella Hangoei, Strain SHTV-5" /LENGTH=59 /DNA_ID=CAMNT_0050896851 /DNA_START=62 /DNA_END=238 /DNA_ORIENTATION=-